MLTQNRIREEDIKVNRDRAVRDFLPYIKYTASRLAWRLPPHMTVDDLISAGIIGLLSGLDRYKEELGSFEYFIKKKIKWAMLDELRSNEDISRTVKEKVNAIKSTTLQMEKDLGRQPEPEEVAQKLGITLDEYYRTLQSLNTSFTMRFEEFTERSEDNLDIRETIADNSIKTPLELYEERNFKEFIAKLIDELSEKEKLVLSLYYWEEMTMKEVAKILGVTEGRVSQIHHQALLKLKLKMDLLKE
jgi:RNA polymerase sigma factor for flagellar operon FliA